MRSPAGTIRSRPSHDTADGYASPSGSARTILVTPPVPSWTTSQIIDELRGSIGQTLVHLRACTVAKDRAIIISHLCRSIAALVGIAAMDSADLTTMSDTELVDLGQKLIRDMVRA